MALQGFKILTFTNIQPGATAHSWWNNANSEVYRLNAWPNVVPGVAASAEITKISGVVHGSPSERDEPWGHSDASGQRVASKGDNTPGLGPAGTVHASLQDWARFIRLHLDGSEGSLTLSPTSLARLHTQYSTNNMYPNRYGWGWIMYDDFGGLALGHDGSNTLWYCSCQVLPGKGLGFLAVSNIGADTNGNGKLACDKIIQKLRERQFQM